MQPLRRRIAWALILLAAACTARPEDISVTEPAPQPRLTHPFKTAPEPALKPGPALDQAEILSYVLPGLQASLGHRNISYSRQMRHARSLSRYEELIAPVPYTITVLTVWDAEQKELLQFFPLTNASGKLALHGEPADINRPLLWQQTDRLKLQQWKPVVGSDHWNALVEQLARSQTDRRSDAVARLIRADLHPLGLPEAERARLNLSLADWLIARHQDLAALHFLRQAEEATYRIATLKNQNEQPIKGLTDDILRLQTILHQRIPGPFEKMKKAIKSWL